MLEDAALTMHNLGGRVSALNVVGCCWEMGIQKGLRGAEKGRKVDWESASAGGREGGGRGEHVDGVLVGEYRRWNGEDG